MGIKISEIAFTGYPVSDVQRAREFYEGILGLTPGDIDGEIPGMPGIYWVEYAIGSQTLALSNAWSPSGQSGPSIALEVDDFQDAIDHLKGHGVKIVAECIETPVCRMALIEDMDRNGITIHKRK
ncbi:MAG: glyoxalase [Nitrospirales bacterium]|nr:MAG: glyoxalase [Nitrospirales bacterium]